MTISVLQRVNTDPGTSSATTAFAMAATVAGSAIVVYTMANFTTVTGVTDTQGNTYVQKNAISSASGNQILYRHVAINTVGGANTVTATWAAASGFRPVCAAEIGGCTTTPIDGTAGQSQNPPGAGADAVTSGNASNSNQPALVEGFSVVIFNTNAPTAGTGFTSETAVWGGAGSGSGARPENLRITATGARAATFTRAVAVEHLTIIGMFDELNLNPPPKRRIRRVVNTIFYPG
jgi:hypothetical protein